MFALKFETLFSNGTEKNFHHWLLYECDKRYEFFLRNNTEPAPGPCFPQYATDSSIYDMNWRIAQGFCQKISLSWAVGGDRASVAIILIVFAMILINFTNYFLRYKTFRLILHIRLVAPNMSLNTFLFRFTMITRQKSKVFLTEFAEIISRIALMYILIVYDISTWN